MGDDDDIEGADLTAKERAALAIGSGVVRPDSAPNGPGEAGLVYSDVTGTEWDIETYKPMTGLTLPVMFSAMHFDRLPEEKTYHWTAIYLRYAQHQFGLFRVKYSTFWLRVKGPRFNKAVYFAIFISSMLLAMEGPASNPHPMVNGTLVGAVDTGILFFFLFEFVARTAWDGMAYFRVGWNVLVRAAITRSGSWIDPPTCFSRPHHAPVCRTLLSCSLVFSTV